MWKKCLPFTTFATDLLFVIAATFAYQSGNQSCANLQVVKNQEEDLECDILEAGLHFPMGSNSAGDVWEDGTLAGSMNQKRVGDSLLPKGVS